MKILFLTYKLPHSQVVGGNRIVFNRIKYLIQKGNSVGLISYTHNETDEEIESLRVLLTELHIGSQPVKFFSNDYTISRRPYIIWKLYSKWMTKKVADVVEDGHYDIVIAEFSEMGQFLYKNPYLSAVHTMISCHRCITSSYEKYREMEEMHLKLHLKSRSQIKKIEKYEFNMYRSVDRILVFTPQDRFTTQYYAPDLAVSVSSAGIDITELNKYSPVPKEPIILMTG
ncbi:MAG: hypothetical protein HRT57_04435, partial [Crocinitomicaceae bacterium]|nr:hypothetical protein [Crocinitomicaceae bacterium]